MVNVTIIIVIIIVIIIIIIHTYFTAVQLVLKKVMISPADQALPPIHSSAKNFRNIRYVLSVTAFCITIYRAGV
jgi:hypothetical protein